MAEDKALPPGVIEQLEWKPQRADCEKVTKVYIAKIFLRKHHLELFVGYDFEAMWIDEHDIDSPKKKFMDLVRIQQLIPKQQISLQRTQYNHIAENEDPKELGKLYHAIVLRNQGFEFWLYMGEKDASRVFKRLKEWMLNTVEIIP